MSDPWSPGINSSEHEHHHQKYQLIRQSKYWYEVFQRKWLMDISTLIINTKTQCSAFSHGAIFDDGEQVVVLHRLVEAETWQRLLLLPSSGDHLRKIVLPSKLSSLITSESRRRMITARRLRSMQYKHILNIEYYNVQYQQYQNIEYYIQYQKYQDIWWQVHAVQAERMRARSDWFLSDPSGLVTIINSPSSSLSTSSSRSLGQSRATAGKA